MKLAEALILRADMQKKLLSLRQRIAKNAVHQEGSTPHEAPQKLLEESFHLLGEMRILIEKINKKNASTSLADGRSLTQAIAMREELGARHSLLTHAIEHSSKEPDRYSMAEIKWVSSLKVAALQAQSDDLARKIREMNILLQEANWKTDLE